MTSNFIGVVIKGQRIRLLVDTGSGISIVSMSRLKEIVGKKPRLAPSDIPCIHGISAGPVRILGTYELSLNINEAIFPTKFYVLSSINQPILVGLDFLKSSKAVIDASAGMITFCDDMVGAVLVSPDPDKVQARLVKTVVLKPGHECLTRAVISGNHSFGTKEVVLEPYKRDDYIFVARTVSRTGRNRSFPCSLMNLSDLPIRIQAGTAIGTVTGTSKCTVNRVITSQQHETEFAQCNEMGNSGCTVNRVEVSQGDQRKSHKGGDRPEYASIAKELGIKLEGSELSEQERVRLLELIGQNRDVFATGLKDLGYCDISPCKINTLDEVPVSQKPYRTTPQARDEIERQVNDLVEAGIVKKSFSPYASPVVLVKKKSGDFRLCVDYRRLNAKTHTEQWQLPTLDHVLDSVGDANPTIFSSLDLGNAYFQIAMDPETAHKTAFCTMSGRYQFNRLSFGMKNAPSWFQRILGDVLSDIAFRTCLVYIDDIIIWSKDADTHMVHLQQVFDRLRAAGLTLKASKCHFGRSEVPYLGHIFTPKGIKADMSKIEAMVTFPQPQTKKDIRSLLGLCNYYKKFCKGYCKTVAPLNKILSKDIDFRWNDPEKVAFKTLKTSMTTPPILAYPKFDRDFIITTDASGEALSYMLGQLDDEGRETVIAYGGRSLTPAERKYTISELECLALITAMRQYYPYLATNKIIAYTDHISLKYLNNLKINHHKGRLARWALYLQGFNLEIRHRKGKWNQADALSRRKYDPPTPEEAEDPSLPCVYSVESSTSKPVYSVTLEVDTPDSVNLWSTHDLPSVQRSDPKLSPLFEYIENGKLPDDDKKIQKLVTMSERYAIVDDVLYHIHEPRNRSKTSPSEVVKQLVVPCSLQEQILVAYHDSLAGGHNGVDRTFRSIQAKYFWDGMYSDVHNYVKTCHICQVSKKTTRPNIPPLHPMEIVDVYSRWHVDLMINLPETKDGYKHILLLVDSMSRWPEAFPLKSQSASEISDIIYSEIICRYGAPVTLVSDRGKNLLSAVVANLCKMFGVKRNHTSSYKPEANSACERMNRTIAAGLRAYCGNNSTNWPKILPSLMMTYRNIPCTKSTNFSPFYLCFGRQMRTPIDAALLQSNDVPATVNQYLSDISRNIDEGREIAQKNVAEAQGIYKHYYDRGQNPEGVFGLGDYVLLKEMVKKGKGTKTNRPYTGPYYVVVVGDNHTYRLRSVETNALVPAMVHAKRIIKYTDPANRNGRPRPSMGYDQGARNSVGDTPDLCDLGGNGLNDMRMKTKSQCDNSQSDKKGKHDSLCHKKMKNKDDSNQSHRNNKHDSLCDNAKSKNGDKTPHLDVKRENGSKGGGIWYEAVKLLGVRGQGTKREYKVQWEDPTHKPSWIVMQDVSPLLIQQYHIHKTLKGRARKRKH